MRRWTSLVVLFSLGACGGSDPGTGPGTGIVTVAMSPNNANLLISETRILGARDGAGNLLSGVAWSTNASSVATVSLTGVITAVGDGSATITATAGGASGTISVTVSSLTFASVTAGGAHTCALTTSGAAYCWGRGEFGQLGVAPPQTTCSFDGQELACSSIPIAVQGGLTFTQLDAATTHTCGLTSAGAAYCWGRNNAGQLGDNSTTNSANDQKSAPAAVSGGLVFTKISAASSHACGLTASGAAYCWGANGRGQLGDGTQTNRAVPVAVGGGLSFNRITTGGFASGMTCGLTNAGAAYCWGENTTGQLGIGTTDNNAHPSPTPVSGGLVFTTLDAGPAHACGATSAGATYCWGANVLGALGDGSIAQRSVPTAVTGGLAFAQVVLGGFSTLNAHTCGLTSSAQGFCWGDNEAGALGDGTNVNRSAPSAVSGQLSFNAISAGYRHTCGMASTGVLYCWGSNGARQLGINSTAAQTAPTKVIGQK